MKKIEDIDGAFLAHITRKSLIWCIIAALVAAAAAYLFQKSKTGKQQTNYRQTSTVFIALNEHDSKAEPAEGSAPTPAYKIVRVAFDSEQDDATRARYYELHSRNAFMADYRIMLDSKMFADKVENAYQQTYSCAIPDYTLSSQIVVAVNRKQQENSRFLEITVETAGKAEAEQITATVLQQFEQASQELLGFKNIRIIDSKEPVAVTTQGKKINLKLVVFLAVAAAGFLWLIALIIFLRRSEVLNEQDIKNTLGEQPLITVLRKRKTMVRESAELCCRMLEKDPAAGQVLVGTVPTAAEYHPGLIRPLFQGFSALGHNTLLIDLASGDGSAGIADFIEGRNGLEEILQKKDGGSTISSGSNRMLTTTQLNSKVFRDLMADLRLQYSTILIAVPGAVDTPAVSLLDDVADSVILMVQTGRTREKDLATAVTQLKNCKIKKYYTVLVS